MVTVHGFRSAFRDWVAEQTGYSGEVAEAALAHTVSNKVEAAYRRTDFDKRRLLMRDWATYCKKVPAPSKEERVEESSVALPPDQVAAVRLLFEHPALTGEALDDVTCGKRMLARLHRSEAATARQRERQQELIR